MLNLQTFEVVRRVVQPVRLETYPGHMPANDASVSPACAQASTLLAEIAPGEVDGLEALLTAIGDDIRGNPHIRFERMTSVHFLRWVVLRRGPQFKADYLVLEGSHDGSTHDFLRELVAVGEAGVRRIYSKCLGYATHSTAAEGGGVRALVAFLAAGSVVHAASYVANPGLGVPQIRTEAAVFDALQHFLDRQPSGQSPQALYGAIREHLSRLGLLSKLALPHALPAQRVSRARQLCERLRPLIGSLCALPLLPALLLPGSASAEGEADSPRDQRMRVARLAAREDRKLHNPLTHVAAIKPGRVRRRLLGRVLSVIDVLCRDQFNQAELGAIHFARWVVLDAERVLLFFSDYDGSWESHVDELFDRASVGLNAIWRHALGFPKTARLWRKSARDARRFKSFARAHQVDTALWYSAYPNLTLADIRRNQRVAAGLRKPLTEPHAIAQWLQLL